MNLHDLVYDSLQLGILIEIDLIIVVNTLNLPVRRNDDNVHVVDLAEFILLRLGSTSHSG